MDVLPAIGNEMKTLTANVEQLIELEMNIYFKWRDLIAMQKEWRELFGLMNDKDLELLRKVTGRRSRDSRLYITKKGLKAIKDAPKSDKDIDWS